MKKIKLIIMTLAILLSIGGAFATRPHYDCTFSTQYFWNGSGYSPAGTFGTTYGCMSSSATCSYVLINGVYTQCRIGTYTSLTTTANPTTKTK